MRTPLKCLLAGLILLAGGCAACDRQSASVTQIDKAEGTATPASAPASEQAKATNMANPEATGGKVEMTEAQWRQKLTPEQFEVLRQKGTERAFTGKYWDTKTPGVYSCAGCGTVLFTSGDKFDSGCGWPSFDKLAAAGVVQEHRDTTHGMVRTEVTCARCGGHLGHLFDDGPTATRMRYCINSASITLDPNEGTQGEQKPK